MSRTIVASYIYSVVILAAAGPLVLLLLLRGLGSPGADHAEGPVQAGRHDGNGVTADPTGGDVLRQEVVLTDQTLLSGVLLVCLPQRRQPHLIETIAVTGPHTGVRLSNAYGSVAVFDGVTDGF